MIKKLFTEKELEFEKKAGSPGRYIMMLKCNNELLQDKLKKAIGFLELQEEHVSKGIVFLWREIVIGEEKWKNS